MAFPQIHFVEGAQVTDLLANDDKSRVTGVQLRSRHTQDEQTRAADFIVDATGRGSKTPEWLQALGYAAPRESAINSFQGYATRWYKRPEHLKLDWKALIVSTKPPTMSRGGGIYPIENDQWIVTIGGVNKDFPPNDDAGFMEFARTLRSPLLAEVLQHAEPISPVYGYQRTENHLRHYEELGAMPEGIVVVGDAVCAFNPVYGQGMTAAAMGAMVLDKCLQQGVNSAISLRFQKALAKSNETAWLMATGEDFRWPNTEGKRPQVNMATRFVQRYMDYITELIVDEPVILTAFYQVAHLLKSPAALFQPAIFARVLRKALSDRMRGKAHDRPIGQPPTAQTHEENVLAT